MMHMQALGPSHSFPSTVRDPREIDPREIPECVQSAERLRLCARDGDMNVKFREITHVSPAALANFMKFQPLFWLGKFHYEFHEMYA